MGSRFVVHDGCSRSLLSLRKREPIGPLARLVSASCILAIACLALAAGSPPFASALCDRGLFLPASAFAQPARVSLPAPVVNPHSTEICLNSRISYHGGWGGTATEQMLGDALAACACAPLTGSFRMIYAATATNVYRYDAAAHSLTVHKSGDWRSDGTAVFEVGIAADNYVDAGAAMHLAQLESVALWAGTAAQLASCPRATAVTYANSHWDPEETIDIAISFGMRTVQGFTATRVATSSDGTLPDPVMDGSVYLDDALANPAYDSTFTAEELTTGEVSQLLWAAYGCSNHRVSGSRAGLVCASAVANYYLTRRIYLAAPSHVFRYHNHLPPGSDLNSRDHRLETLSVGDARPALRAAARLPECSHDLIVCVASTGAWPEVEVGFAAMGALVQAWSLGLQGYTRTAFTSEEQAAIRQAAGIPAGEIPIAIVCLGHARQGADIEDHGAANPHPGDVQLRIDGRITAGADVSMRYRLPAAGTVELSIHDCLGRRVSSILAGDQERGTHEARWDVRDEKGRPVVSGVYYCRLQTGGQVRTASIVVLR